MAWVQEKLPSATAQDYGQSLSTVRHLQEKHQVLAHAGRLGRVCLCGAGGSQSRTGHRDPAKPLLWGHLDSLEMLGWKLFRRLKDLSAPAWGVGSPIVGTSVVLRSLQNLENEISSHTALSQAVVGMGHKLVQAGHFAAEEVAARVQQLEVALDHLRTGAARRRMLLQQALEAQQILMEVRGCCRCRDVRAGLRTPGVYGLKDDQGQGERCSFCSPH